MPNFASDIFVRTKIPPIFISFSSLVLIFVLVLDSSKKDSNTFGHYRYRCRHRRRKKHWSSCTGATGSASNLRSEVAFLTSGQRAATYDDSGLVLHTLVSSSVKLVFVG